MASDPLALHLLDDLGLRLVHLQPAVAVAVLLHHSPVELGLVELGGRLLELRGRSSPVCPASSPRPGPGRPSIPGSRLSMIGLSFLRDLHYRGRGARPPFLQVDEAHVVVGRVGRHAVDHAGHELRVHEGRREHGQRSSGDRRASPSLPSSSLPLNSRMTFTLCCCSVSLLAADELMIQSLPVDLGLAVGAVRMQPDVGRAEDRLRPQRAGHEPSVPRA